MAKLRALVVRWHSDDFPGWVEVSVRDARGQDHRIIEKAAVVAPPDTTADSSFPIECWIEAEVEGVDGDDMVVTLPHSMETTEGARSIAVVPAETDQARYLHDRQWLDYATYIRDRRGPSRVASPAVPDWIRLQQNPVEFRFDV